MNKSGFKNAFPPPHHDHHHCADQAIHKARALFSSKKLLLTPLRERIYRQILTSHNALGAYQLLECLNKNDRKTAPITIYRILDLLCEIGLIHRLQSQNTYFACYQNHDSQNSTITLICRKCGTIAELLDETIDKAFEVLERNVNFITENRVLEIEGICPECHQVDHQKC